MGFRFDAIEKMAGRLITSRVETRQTEAQGEKAPRKSEAPRRSDPRDGVQHASSLICVAAGRGRMLRSGRRCL